ncbi:hypothetical protein [Jannaschia sp. LMIT008]|uniref:hypothetical protein n=1 Tax=Jannaschia maritima TaxID=3032585 RepID=UPI002812662A|nr:hypothetical protein [Jannaschia sp. LMIT008]
MRALLPFAVSVASACGAVPIPEAAFTTVLSCEVRRSPSERSLPVRFGYAENRPAAAIGSGRIGHLTAIDPDPFEATLAVFGSAGSAAMGSFSTDEDGALRVTTTPFLRNEPPSYVGSCPGVVDYAVQAARVNVEAARVDRDAWPCQGPTIDHGIGEIVTTC